MTAVCRKCHACLAWTSNIIGWRKLSMAKETPVGSGDCGPTQPEFRSTSAVHRADSEEEGVRESSWGPTSLRMWPRVLAQQTEQLPSEPQVLPTCSQLGPSPGPRHTGISVCVCQSGRATARKMCLRRPPGIEQKLCFQLRDTDIQFMASLGNSMRTFFGSPGMSKHSAPVC